MPGCGGTPGGGTGSSHRQRRLRARADRLARRVRHGLREAARRRATIGRAQDEIGGRPAVTLGGDYWHTPAIRSAPQQLPDPRRHEDRRGSWSRRRSRSRGASSYSASAGVRDGAAIELRVTPKAAKRAGLKALDKPDADGYVAVKVAFPTGTDVLTETAWDLGAANAKTLIGEVAKVRLRLAGGKEPPPPARRLHPARGQATGEVPPAGLGLGRHPLPPDGAGGVRRADPRPHARPREDLGSCIEHHGYKHENLLHPGTCSSTAGATTTAPSRRAAGRR